MNITAYGLITAISGIINYTIPILLGFSFLYFIYSIFKRIRVNIETKRKANIRIIKSIALIFFFILIWATLAIFNSTTHRTVTYYFKNNAYITYPEMPIIQAKIGEKFRLYRTQKAIIEDIDAYIKYIGSRGGGYSYQAVYDFKYLNPKNKKDSPEKDGYCVSQKMAQTIHGISDEYFDFIVFKNKYGDNFSCDGVFLR
jgi:hypothetical protein